MIIGGNLVTWEGVQRKGPIRDIRPKARFSGLGRFSETLVNILIAPWDLGKMGHR